MIKEILSKVAKKRLEQENPHHTIRLSEFLIRKFVEENNITLTEDIASNFMIEMHYTFHDHKFLLQHRFYRSDCTDNDVEEELYDELTKCLQYHMEDLP